MKELTLIIECCSDCPYYRVEWDRNYMRPKTNEYCANLDITETEDTVITNSADILPNCPLTDYESGL